MDLFAAFSALQTPTKTHGPETFNSVQIAGAPYRVAKDRTGGPVLLLRYPRGSDQIPRIRLEHLDVQPLVRCRVSSPGGTPEEGSYTVVRCVDADEELVRYFFRVLDPILGSLGQAADAGSLVRAITNLTELFRALAQPPSQPVAGLWAELSLIRCAGVPETVAEAWHPAPTDRYDFSAGAQRVEVKSTSMRTRSHVFSLEQLLPPAGCTLLVASLFVERAGGGTSLGTLIDEVRELLSTRQDLLERVDRIVATTLGASLRRALAERFDREFAAESLRYYTADSIPRVRTPLPRGVSEVHFRTDLSATPTVDLRELRSRGGLFAAI